MQGEGCGERDDQQGFVFCNFIDDIQGNSSILEGALLGVSLESLPAWFGLDRYKFHVLRLMELWLLASRGKNHSEHDNGKFWQP